MEQKVSNKLQNKYIGNQGELIAAQYYKDKGFQIIEMNYRKKWGEIDVIAQKGHKIYFIEVKTVSYETKNDLIQAVARGTHHPEENVHENKLRKLYRAIESWISEHKWLGDFQIDVAAVRIVPRETFASVNIIENVITN